MGLDTLLSRLQGVKPGNAVGRFMARCPAHSDRSPSLAIRMVDDGRILLHCFAGCGTDAVLGALGMEIGELFPESLTREFKPKVYAPFSALDALKCLTGESAVIAIAASDIARGKPLSDRDNERVSIAAGRIASALEVVHGN